MNTRLVPFAIYSMLSIFFCSYFYLCIILYNHQWVTDSNTSRVTDVSGNNNDNDNWPKKNIMVLIMMIVIIVIRITRSYFHHWYWPVHFIVGIYIFSLTDALELMLLRLSYVFVYYYQCCSPVDLTIIMLFVTWSKLLMFIVCNGSSNSISDIIILL